MLGAGDAAKRSSRIHPGVRICELSMVPGIEELAAQGELRLAIHREGLVSPHVPVVEAGTGHPVELEVSECVPCLDTVYHRQLSIDQINGIGGRINVAPAARLILKDAIYDLVREPVTAIRSNVPARELVAAVTVLVDSNLAWRPGCAVRSGDCERKSCLHRTDCIEAPPADHFIQTPVHIGPKLLSTPNW